jgi:hypothetical protein
MVVVVNSETTMNDETKPDAGGRVYDPILSPEAMCDDAGISMSTWRRHYRHKLPIEHLSPRRIGCRQSKWRAALKSEREQAA